LRQQNNLCNPIILLKSAIPIRFDPHSLRSPFLLLNS
jgi:hypothetical protein